MRLMRVRSVTFCLRSGRTGRSTDGTAFSHRPKNSESVQVMLRVRHLLLHDGPE